MPNEFAGIARETALLDGQCCVNFRGICGNALTSYRCQGGGVATVLARVGVGAYGERSEVRSRARQNMLPVTRAAQLLVPGIR